MRHSSIYLVSILLTAANVFFAAVTFMGKGDNSKGLIYRAHDYVRHLRELRRLAVESVTLVETGNNTFDVTVEGESEVANGDAIIECNYCKCYALRLFSLSMKCMIFYGIHNVDSFGCVTCRHTRLLSRNM